MTAPTKQVVLSRIKTSEKEVKDLLKAWVAISIAFAILFSNGISFSYSFLFNFILSSFTVGIAFLFHEIAHKLTAQHYGCFAEFRSSDSMLLIAILMSFFGFIFAAPGAVLISGPVGKRRNGTISLAGPLSNIIMAMIFFALFFIGLPPIIIPFLVIGFFINSLLALFNMIPFGNFDGRKIFEWNKAVFSFMVAIGIISLFVSYRYYSLFLTGGV